MITHIGTSTVVPLDAVTAQNRARAGGKAFNCARLKQAGFPVPDGVIILSTASDADVAAVADHPWFAAQPADAFFAVRSSGIDEDGEGESFAGIHETFLNVPRSELAGAVLRCRQSAFTLQALEYRRAKGMAVDDIEIGVLIQRMAHPIVAGVAFTINPITGAQDEIVVNASWGLGEALVSGRVDPDEFVVRKSDARVRWSRIGEKGGGAAGASLTATELGELTKMAVAIEREYGGPQDIEWCHDGARFSIVQSRPVTAVVPSSDEPEWTRANLAEVFPDVTSFQALSAFEGMLERAERMHLRSLAAPAETLGPIVKAFHGRLYFNLTQLRRVCAVGKMAPAVMLRSMGHAEAIEPSDEQISTVSGPPAKTRDLLRLGWRHLRIDRVIRKHDADMRTCFERFTATDPRTLSDRNIASTIDQWIGEAHEYLQPVLLLSGVSFHESKVANACAKVEFPSEHLVYPQLALGERSVSAQQAFDLVELADIARHEPGVVTYLTGAAPTLDEMRATLQRTVFLSAFETFLRTYGHRGLYEYDWSLPRYRDDPTPLLSMLQVHLQDGADEATGQDATSSAASAAQAWADFERRLTRWQRWTLVPSVRRSIKKIKQYYLWRERVRFDLVRVLAEVRVWHLVLAQRFVDRGLIATRDDYFMLSFEEVNRAIDGQHTAGELHAMVVQRSREAERRRTMQMPLLMRESTLPALIRLAGVSGDPGNDDQLTGLPVSGGYVEAEVVVVHDPGDFSRMKRGAILVAPATDPSWTPLFTLASGVIVEVGGVLSHASTIAREYGLPALANVKHATRRLRNGERVRLDAVRGTVERLEV
jgi:rifampicin phosphotransferase